MEYYRNHSCISCLLAAFLALVTGNFSAAQTFSNEFAAFSSNQSGPIDIEAEQLEIIDENGVAIFTGNVIVTQAQTRLDAQRLEVRYQGRAVDNLQGNIENLEAIGAVTITTPTQFASGDRAAFDMKSQIMVMTGDTVILQEGKNRAAGNRLTVDLTSGRAKLEAAEGQKIRLSVTPSSS